MKASVERTGAEGFRSFNLTLTIANENEARMLWHLFNLTDEDVYKFVRKHGQDTEDLPLPVGTVHTYAVYEALTAELKEQGVLK